MGGGRASAGRALVRRVIAVVGLVALVSSGSPLAALAAGPSASSSTTSLAASTASVGPRGAVDYSVLVTPAPARGGQVELTVTQAGSFYGTDVVLDLDAGGAAALHVDTTNWTLGTWEALASFRGTADVAASVSKPVELTITAPSDPPPTLADPSALSGQATDTCALTASGSLACWGTSGGAVAPVGTYRSVAAGGHSCAVTTAGVPVCWGGDISVDLTPPGGTFLSLAVGASSVCGLRTDKTLACWGSTTSFIGPLIPPTGTFASLVGGEYDACALDDTGVPTCWGDAAMNALQPGGSFDQVSLGLDFACGLRASGSIVCWGNDFFGQTEPPPGSYRAVATSGNIVCGLLVAGSIQCWGDLTQGPPAGIPGQFDEIAVGDYSVCARAVAGGYACWAGSHEPLGAAPLMLSDPPANAVIGVPYQHTFLASLESPAPTYRVTAGVLPPGLVLAPSGVLSGTPTTIGTFGPTTVTASDSIAPPVPQTFSISIGHGVSRLGGATRFATAAAISAATWPVPGSAEVAYVANAYSFPDALGAAAAAGSVRGPVLLAAATLPLDAATAAELARLRPSRIIVVGGSAVISDAVLNALKPVATTHVVDRYAGPNRFTTAAAISANTWPQPGIAEVAYIANYNDYPDALGAAAAAGTVAGPVLLTRAILPIDPATAAELTRLQPRRIVVVGGSSVVSDAVLAALAPYATTHRVDRYSGPDRFKTAAQISANMFTPGEPAAYLAYGYNFPDALGGAAAAGTVQGPVLLISANLPVDPAVIAELTRLGPRHIYVLGGPGVIADPVLAALTPYALGP